MLPALTNMWGQRLVCPLAPPLGETLTLPDNLGQHCVCTAGRVCSGASGHAAEPLDLSVQLSELLDLSARILMS